MSREGKGDQGWGYIFAALAGAAAGAAGYWWASKDDPPKKKPVLDQMKEHILRDQSVLTVKQLADEIVNGLHYTDSTRRLQAIHTWITTRLEYKPDPASVDQAQPILETLSRKPPGGDCDCLTTAFSTLAEAAGHKVSLLTVPKDSPSHVLAVFRVPQDWAERNHRVCSIITTFEGDHHGFWLPFDPVLEPGSAGRLHASTLAHVQRGEAQIHPIA